MGVLRVLTWLPASEVFDVTSTFSEGPFVGIGVGTDRTQSSTLVSPKGGEVRRRTRSYDGDGVSMDFGRDGVGQRVCGTPSRSCSVPVVTTPESRPRS